MICLLIDEEGQARDVEWKMEVAHRIHELATERYGLSASDLIFDALTFPLSTGDDDLRRDAMATIEAIRRIKAEIPGAYTTLGVSNVSFGLTPAGPPRPQQRVPARVRAGRARLGHRPRRQDHAAEPHPRRAARGLPRPDLRPPRAPDYDPLQPLLEVFADVKSAKAVKEDRSGWPVEERLKQRIIDGDRDGLDADLDEALAAGHRPAGHRQRRAARRA